MREGEWYFLLPPESKILLLFLKEREILVLAKPNEGHFIYTACLRLVSRMHAVIRSHYRRKRVLWHRGLPTRNRERSSCRLTVKKGKKSKTLWEMRASLT